MGFSEQTTGIPEWLEAFGEDRNLQRDTWFHLPGYPVGTNVIPKSETLLVPSGQEAGPGRSAHRASDIPVGQSHPALGNRINARSRDISALVPHISITQVIRQKDHKIGFPPKTEGQDPKKGPSEPRDYALVFHLEIKSFTSAKGLVLSTCSAVNQPLRAVFTPANW